MHVRLYCDGGNIGKNPSVAVYWSVAREHDDGRIEKLTDRAVSTSYTTNNHAEYLALTDALTHAGRIAGTKRLTIYSDSQLIVNQFNGRFKVTEGPLRVLCRAAQQNAQFLMDTGVQVEVVWVRREASVKRLGH